MPIGGSGKSDLWALELDPAAAPILSLGHWNGSSVKHMPLPAAAQAATQQFAFASAKAGTVWMVGTASFDQIIALEVDATGTVVSDRSADFPVATGGSYGRVRASGGRGGVFVETFDTTSHVYRLVGDQFVPVTLPIELGGAGPDLVVGPDEAWFRFGSGGLTHYSAGTWTTVALPPGGTGGQVHGSVDDSGVYYTLGSPPSERQNLPGGNFDDPPFKLFVNVLKVANDQATTMRFEWGDNTSFQPTIVIGLGAGSFALLGNEGSRVLARRGTASGFATSDTIIHQWGCVSPCAGTFGELFEDRTFILEGTLRGDKDGWGTGKRYLGTASDLP
jgi:hypothetical protein